MRTTFLPFSPPLIGDEEIQEVVQTLKSDWLTTGPKTKKFEDEIAAYVGRKEAVALNSCTAGLHLALVALDIKPGDEVITTPLTFAATANVIEHVGAKPVFADIEGDTMNIDPKEVEKKITPKTKAILAVHYAGHPFELDTLQALAAKHKIPLIEDAAHGIAAEYKGQKIGARDNFCSFSFYATKNLSTAEGGMLTGPTELLDRARKMGLHGLSKDAWKRFSKTGSWQYDVLAPGFKYNMTDIQASLGLAQLKRLPAMQKRREEIVKQYDEALKQLEIVQLPTARPEVTHAWHLYVVRPDFTKLKITRDELIDKMKERNIGVSVHYIPVHTFTYYREKYGYKPQDFPKTWRAYENMLSLPLSPRHSDQDIQDSIEAFTDLIRQNLK